MLVRKVSLGGFGSGLAGTPWHHIFHFTGDAALAQLVFENSMDIRLLVLVLNLVAAFLATHFTRAQHRRLARLPSGCRIFAGKALVQDQVSGRRGTHVEVLMQPKPLAGA